MLLSRKVCIAYKIDRCTKNQMKLGTSVLFYTYFARFLGVMYQENANSRYIGSVEED